MHRPPYNHDTCHAILPAHPKHTQLTMLFRRYIITRRPVSKRHNSMRNMHSDMHCSKDVCLMKPEARSRAYAMLLCYLDPTYIWQSDPAPAAAPINAERQTSTKG